VSVPGQGCCRGSEEGQQGIRHVGTRTRGGEAVRPDLIAPRAVGHATGCRLRAADSAPQGSTSGPRAPPLVLEDPRQRGGTARDDGVLSSSAVGCCARASTGVVRCARCSSWWFSSRSRLSGMPKPRSASGRRASTLATGRRATGRRASTSENLSGNRIDPDSGPAPSPSARAPAIRSSFRGHHDCCDCRRWLSASDHIRCRYGTTSHWPVICHGR